MTTETYTIPPEEFDAKSNLIGITGDSGVEVKDSPLGKIGFSWRYDRLNGSLALSILSKPFFVSEKTIFRHVAAQLGTEIA